MNLGGVTFRFIDTAGLRQTTDAVERMGIDRTYTKMEQATIVLWMIDATDLSTAERLLSDIQTHVDGKTLLVLFNKCDLLTTAQRQAIATRFTPIGHRQLFLSARNGDNLDELRHALVEMASLPDLAQDAVVVTNARHYEALRQAASAIHRASDGLKQNLSGDFVSQDIRECIYHLSDIAGDVTSDSILQNIFRRFCIGK